MKQKLRKNSKAITEYRKRFYNLYHTKIVPILMQFEQERKSILFRLFTLEFIALGFLLTAIVLIIISTHTDYGDRYYELTGWLTVLHFLCIIIGVLSIQPMITLPFSYNSKFVKTLKANCMPKIIAGLDNLSWVEGKANISEKKLAASQLFALHNRVGCEDTFDGLYNGVHFKIAETLLCYDSGSGRSRTIVPVFNGVIISFAANKNIKNTTIIATKNDKNIKNNFAVALVGVLVMLFQLLRPDSYGHFNIVHIILAVILIILVVVTFLLSLLCPGEVLEEMKLEDPEFNKKYKAYSSDQVEGRYLITPAFIERFNNLQTAFGTNKAKCSFYGHNLMFAISTNKNLFEIGNLFKRLDDPKQMETFFNELASIMALVDLFKLDEKTGL